MGCQSTAEARCLKIAVAYFALAAPKSRTKRATELIINPTMSATRFKTAIVMPTDAEIETRVAIPPARSSLTPRPPGTIPMAVAMMLDNSIARPCPIETVNPIA